MRLYLAITLRYSLDLWKSQRWLSNANMVSGPQCRGSGVGWGSWQNFPMRETRKEVFGAMRSWWRLTNTSRKVGNAHGHHLWLSWSASWIEPLLNWHMVCKFPRGAFCSSHLPPPSHGLIIDCKWLSIHEVLCLLCQYKLVFPLICLYFSQMSSY